jgi:dCTP deaminase
VILCQRDIKKALLVGDLVINPAPEKSQYSTTALDLRVGLKFWKFKDPKPGIVHTIDFDLIRETAKSYQNLIEFIEPVDQNSEGAVILKQNGFLLIETLEKITLPLEGQLAARVEGRSSLARLGVSVHMTAPVVHCGFSGVIYLEVKNEGPLQLKIWPGKTRLCQVVFEMVSSIPSEGLGTIFMDQDKPTGKVSS